LGIPNWWREERAKTLKTLRGGVCFEREVNPKGGIKTRELDGNCSRWFGKGRPVCVRVFLLPLAPPTPPPPEEEKKK